MLKILTTTLAGLWITFSISPAMPQVPVSEFECIEYSETEKVYVEAANSDPACLLKVSFKFLRQRDVERALKWLLVSAERGNPKAQTIVAGRYLSGRGFPKDLKKAVEWYKKAAEGGHYLAKSNLSAMYLTGNQYVEKNPRKAALVVLELARQGHISSIQQVPAFYANGIGLNRNSIEAYKWALLAKKHGFISDGLFQQIDRNLSSDKKTEIQNSVDVWMKQYVRD